VNREGERLEAEFVQDLTSFVAQGDFLSVAGLEDKTLRMTGPEPISLGT